VGEDAFRNAPTVNTRIKCDDNDVLIPLPPGSVASRFYPSAQGPPIMAARSLQKLYETAMIMIGTFEVTVCLVAS
jgi:hypothetical protein